ncbi:MAG TPA: c-type cytochrome domain-containing protein, partial [Bacteroidales bacterium]|nr:c-type cytochrome domain-containing protein [Bacteroidales bacterium]
MKIKNLVLSGVVILLISLFMMTGIFSCKHDPSGITGLPEICFESDVLPVFQTSCALSGCHDGRGGGESHYIFTDYQHIMEAVTPDKPESSPAYTALSAIWSEGMMPPDQPLSLDNRTKIRIWILQGAQNTTCIDTTSPPPPPPDTGAYINPRACFQRDIFPVIQSSCAVSGCHDGTSGENEFIATSYSSIMQAVRPGQPNESKLYRVITTGGGEDKMPPFPYDPLTSAQIDSIYNWISYGAPDEDCGEVCDTTSTITYAGVIWPLIETNCLGCHSGANPSGGVSL